MKTALIAFALCLGATAALADMTWSAFNDPNGAFTAEFCARVSISHVADKTADGLDMTIAIYSVSRPGFETVIEDMSGPKVHPDPVRAVDDVARGFKESLTQVASDTISTVDGWAGRDVIGTNADGDTMRDRIYVVNNHVYQVMTRAPLLARGAADPVLAHFMDSFHFTAR